MKGRKPYPYVVMDSTNDRNRLTKDELAKRDKHEPRIKSNNLRCPAHLGDEAKREWQRIVKLYKEIKEPILSDLDCNALEVYCNAVVRYRKATQKIAETSEVYASKGDLKPRKNPWQIIANEAADQIKKYGELLLLDPVSRARVGLAKAKDNGKPSGIAAFLQWRERNNGT